MRTANTIIMETCASLTNIKSMSPNQVYEECIKESQKEAFNEALSCLYDECSNLSYITLSDIEDIVLMLKKQ